MNSLGGGKEVVSFSADPQKKREEEGKPYGGKDCTDRPSVRGGCTNNSHLLSSFLGNSFVLHQGLSSKGVSGDVKLRRHNSKKLPPRLYENGFVKVGGHNGETRTVAFGKERGQVIPPPFGRKTCEGRKNTFVCSLWERFQLDGRREHGSSQGEQRQRGPKG